MGTDGIDLLAESFGEWKLSFSRMSFGSDGGSLTVQIELDGLARARLSVSNTGLDDKDAVALLREKARTWIVDYESRPSSGSTDFAPI